MGTLHPRYPTGKRVSSRGHLREEGRRDAGSANRPEHDGNTGPMGAESRAAPGCGMQHTAVYQKAVCPRPARGRCVPEKALALGAQWYSIQGRGELGAVTQVGHGTWRAAERSAESGTYLHHHHPCIGNRGFHLKHLEILRKSRCCFLWTRCFLLTTSPPASPLSPGILQGFPMDTLFQVGHLAGSGPWPGWAHVLIMVSCIPDRAIPRCLRCFL